MKGLLLEILSYVSSLKEIHACDALPQVFRASFQENLTQDGAHFLFEVSQDEPHQHIGQ